MVLRSVSVSVAAEVGVVVLCAALSWTCFLAHRASEGVSEGVSEGASGSMGSVYSACHFVEFLASWSWSWSWSYGWSWSWSYGGGWLSVHVLDLMGSLLCCRAYRLGVQGTKHWLEALLACYIMQFGGTTLTGLVLGQPASWMLGSMGSPRAMLLAWWLVFCCPGDLFWIVMCGFRGILWRGPEFLSAVSGGLAVTTWGIDKVLFNSFHPGGIIGQSGFLWLLCGVMSSSGGGMLCRSLNLLGNASFTFDISNPTQLFDLSSTGDVIRGRLSVNFILSCLYIAVLNPSAMFPWPVSVDARLLGHLVVCICNVMLFLATLVQECDPDTGAVPIALLPSQLISYVLRILFNVPLTITSSQGGAASVSWKGSAIVGAGTDSIEIEDERVDEYQNGMSASRRSGRRKRRDKGFVESKKKQ